MMPQKERLVTKEKAPKRLTFQLVKPVEGEEEPVLIKAKVVNKNQEVVDFPNLKPLPRMFFINKIIRRERTVPRYLLGLIPHGTKVKVDFIVRCNQYWSESLGALSEKIPTFSRELENLLLADDVIQHIEAVGRIKKFILDWNTIKLMLLVFGLTVPFALLTDAGLGLVPNQIIVWGP